MGKRITDRVFQLKSDVTESAANTYTQNDIELPVAVLGANRIQAIEVMRSLAYFKNIPGIENGQSNALVSQWVRDPQTALLDSDSDQVIWETGLVNENDVSGTDGGAAVQLTNPVMQDVAIEGDGRLVLERTIHHAVRGSGNASVKRVIHLLECHLVEISPAEITTLLFLDD